MCVQAHAYVFVRTWCVRVRACVSDAHLYRCLLKRLQSCVRVCVCVRASERVCRVCVCVCVCARACVGV